MLGLLALREEVRVASSFTGSESLVKPGAIRRVLLDSQAVGGKLTQPQLEGVLFML